MLLEELEKIVENFDALSMNKHRTIFRTAIYNYDTQVL
jgi:hypothetical protein